MDIHTYYLLDDVYVVVKKFLSEMHVLMSFESDELMSSKVMSNIAHHLRPAGRSDELLKLITHQAKIASDELERNKKKSIIIYEHAHYNTSEKQRICDRKL